MDVLVTSKNKEEPNKNEGASVATTLNIDFSNTHVSLLLLRIKKIQKIK